MYLIGFLIIGVVAGLLAGLIMKSKASGLFGFIVVAVLGSLMGGALFGAIRQSPQPRLGAHIAAFSGALILLALSEIMKKL